jgi:hypothetical protein
MNRQKASLCLQFNPFGNDCEPHALGQSNDHLCDGSVIRVDKNIPDRSLVDL